MVEPLVMVVDSNREHLLRVILAEHVVVENFANLFRRRNSVARFYQRGFILLADNIHAKFDAFIADKDGRAGNELAHFVLALAAERAVEGVLRIAAADFAHSILRNTLPHTPWSASLRSVTLTPTNQVSHRNSGTAAPISGRTAIPSPPRP